MCRKLILLIVSVVLLGLVAAGAVQAQQDPNLVGWWTFDEGTGTIAHDNSGHGYDGTVTNASWEVGVLGSALNFDAAGHVDAPAQAWSTISRQLTVAFWSYGDPVIQPQANFTFGAFSNVSDNNARVASCHAPWSDGNVYWDTSGDPGATFNPDRISKQATASEYEGEWRHWAFVKNVDTGVQSIYLNGVLWHSATGMTKLMPGNEVTGFSIGDRPAHDSPYGGLIDDFRLYNRALTQSEIKALAARPKAYGPQPASGSPDVIMPLLTWTPGTVAVFEDVYLGTTPDLTEADRVSHQSAMFKMYYHTAWPLVPGQTYYWRINGIDSAGAVYTGDVWSFTAYPLKASVPNPANGATDEFPGITLTWLKGRDAKSNQVYFGSDQAAVASGDASADKGTVDEAAFDSGVLRASTTYYWRVDTVNADGTVLQGDVWSFTTADASTDKIVYEWWSGISGTAVSALTSNAKYPKNPTVREYVDQFASPVNWADNYGQRLYGWLKPPETGDYTFWIAGDDEQQLWLSTDESATNAVMIANVPGWTPANDFDNTGGGTGDADAQMSDPIPLKTGFKYFIMALGKEGGGGDSTSVAWKGGPITTREIIKAQYVDTFPLPPLQAFGPSPVDGAIDTLQTLTLTWSAGEKAQQHAVYLGDDAAAVGAADTSSALFKGQQADTSYDVSALEWGKTYYWRVDEINAGEAGSPWKGKVWSFTTANYLRIDNFESYTNDSPNRLFQTWIDGWGFSEDEFFPTGDPGNGTGASVGHDIWTEGTAYTTIMETSVVRPGSTQSMPLAYDNSNSPFNSEAERTWTSPQDFTAGGGSVLSLQVYGYPAAPTTVAVSETGGKMSLTGAGADIWMASDEFTFAYKTLNGDGALIAKVVSNGTGTNTWAKGGVMIRDSLEGISAHANMVMTGGAGNGATFQNRPVAGGDMSVISGTNFEATSAITLPYWVKIERSGDTMTGSISSDGTAWTVHASVDIVMTAPVYIGLCVTSHAAGEDRTFQFEGIKSTGGVSGQWQGAIIDSPMWNSPQDFYVVLQDSLGKSAVVSNAAAVNSGDWLDVQIPLSQFTGVNAGKIKKMIIGVGSRTNPVADGAGELFIDDIRVIKPAP